MLKLIVQQWDYKNVYITMFGWLTNILNELSRNIYIIYTLYKVLPETLDILNMYFYYNVFFLL